MRVEVVIIVAAYFSSRTAMKSKAFEEEITSLPNIDLFGVQMEENVDALEGVGFQISGAIS